MKRTLFISLILVMAVQLISAQKQTGTNTTHEKYTIENCVNQFDSTHTVKTSVGYQYWFVPQNFLADGQTVKMSVVAPNQATHPPHKHDGDEIFFILEGTAQFFMNGKTTTAGAYSTFYCPVGSEHGISNAGSTVLKYLVIRKYPVK